MTPSSSASAVRTAGRGSLPLKLLPALLLGCFAVQPVLAQTAQPAATAPAGQAAAATQAQAAPERGGEQPRERRRQQRQDGQPNQAPATETAGSTPGTASSQSGTANTATSADPAQAPQGGASDDMATVEVVATRPTNKVDRDVYDLKNDISLSNASASDILNNVPSVTVDPDGTVQLRGNPNVQIMVNGKRDAQFQGDNRGDALNSFPAEAIESIEVINVPGAEFGNEGGSGPIINLVLKRNRKPGSRANLSANKSSGDRYNAFVNGERAAGPYSISGNIGYRKDEGSGRSESQRQDLDPQTGLATAAQNSIGSNTSSTKAVTLGSTFTYNVGERDQAGATVSYSRRRGDNESTSMTQRYGAGMLPSSDFTSYSFGERPSENFGLGASYSHKSGAPGEELKFDLRYTGQSSSQETNTLYDYRLLPVATRYATNSERDSDNRNRILDLSVDYLTPLWETWSLTAGAKYAVNRNDSATNYLAVNPLTGNYEPVPSRISEFKSNDRNAALYATLATKFFSATQVKAGLRGEYTELDVRQPQLGQEDKYYYMNWLPSFYVTQDFSGDAQLQLRLSRRIARPNERDLNPNLVYFSEFYARQGNPDLEPVNNDLFEIAYRDSFFNVRSDFTLFKRREAPVIGNRSYTLPTDPNVIVTSPINFGANDSVGVDMNFNVRKLFIQGLSANLGATISNNSRLRVSNFVTATTQSIEQKNHQETIKLRLAYQFNQESLQLSVNRRGASLNGQGINSATTMSRFTWRHNFTPRLSMNLDVSNLLRKGDQERFVDNEVLSLHSLSTGQPRIVSLGLRYQFGGVTGDDRIRNGGRGMFRGQGGPGGRGDGGGGNGGGWGGGNGGGGGGGGGFGR